MVTLSIAFIATISFLNSSISSSVKSPLTLIRMYIKISKVFSPGGQIHMEIIEIRILVKKISVNRSIESYYTLELI